MPNPNEILQQRLFDSVARPWQDLFPESKLATLLSEEGIQYRNRLYTPIVTLWAMVYQVLCADKSLRNTVKWLRKWRVRESEFPSSDTGAYSKARSRFPETVLAQVFRESGIALEGSVPTEQLWCGRRVKVFDGSTVLMSDTPSNQAMYPQHSNQKQGCGFPLARIVVFFSLMTGAVLCGSLASHYTSETEMSRELYSQLEPGDIAMADQLHGNYVDLALIAQQQADGMLRKHHARKTDFRTEKKTESVTTKWNGVNPHDAPNR